MQFENTKRPRKYSEDQNNRIAKARAVYDRLIRGECQSKISKRLKLPKSTVSEYTSRLKRGGYITAPRGKPLFYQATEKPFLANEIIPLMSTRKGRAPENHRKNVFQIQKGSYNAPILREPAYPIPWHKVWTASNVDQFLFSFYVPEAGGDIVYIRVTGPKGGDVLRIFLPRMDVPIEEMPHQETFRMNIAKAACKWFQHTFKCQLGDPIIDQKPDIAIPLIEPDLIAAAQQGTYRIGEMTIDMSAPHRFAELESKNPTVVVRFAALPDRVDVQDERITELEAKIARLEALVNTNTDKQDKG